MRILMVNAYGYLTGGADYVCFAAAEMLRDRGHEVAFLSTRSDRNVIEDGVFVELRVTHFNRDRLRAGARAQAALGALWNQQAARGMARALRQYRPDVILLHKLYPQLSVAPLVVASRRGVPLVQSLYDYEMLSASAQDHTGGRVDHSESRRAYRVLNTATFAIRRRVHSPAIGAWICGSRFMQARYRAAGIEAEVLPWFVEPPDAEPIGFDAREGVTFVGRLSEEKGVRDVLELVSAEPEIRVTIAGAGPLGPLVEAESGRRPNLRYAGELPHDEAKELTRHARIALMPSRWREPGGLAALEAMSAGTPVIAYANGGLAEYVGDAAAGSVIPPDPKRLISECARLSDDHSLWERYSRAGIAAVRQTHSPQSYVRHLEAVFERARRLAG